MRGGASLSPGRDGEGGAEALGRRDLGEGLAADLDAADRDVSLREEAGDGAGAVADVEDAAVGAVGGVAAGLVLVLERVGGVVVRGDPEVRGAGVEHHLEGLVVAAHRDRAEVLRVLEVGDLNLARAGCLGRELGRLHLDRDAHDAILRCERVCQRAVKLGRQGAERGNKDFRGK